jgi:hypothetical protein
VLVGLAACSGVIDGPKAARNTTPGLACAGAPVSALAPAQAVVLNCTAGGGATTASLAGNGASYLIVAQLATDNAPVQEVPYTLTVGGITASSASASRLPAEPGPVPPPANPQQALDARLRARERDEGAAGSAWSATRVTASASGDVPRSTVPAQGTLRTFHMLAGYSSGANVWKTVTARLEFAGSGVLVYVDTLTPHAGFTASVLADFGRRVDQTFYPIDTTAFGQPSDVDGNGHVIMLMSPVVNAGTPAAVCYSQGYVAGFFNGEDFNGTSDPNSNHGEIFYSMVADPLGAYGCVHNVADVSAAVPGVFLHELQHLIDYSQHVVVHGGKPIASWLDEGLSLVAEELGAAYYESRCPPPACRSTPGQLFPDSALGFVRDFLLDSYSFAARPDTVAVTLSNDAELGSAWRGGAWAFSRWLGDHMPAGFYRKLETGPGGGSADIAAAANGQSFATLYADFALAMYTDSLPGLPRSTTPLADRFVTRNLRQLWANIPAATGTGSGLPAFPLPVRFVSSGATVAQLAAGGMAYWRLDTGGNTPVVTLNFAAPDGTPLDPALVPQLVIFRLPPGQ